MKFKVCILAAVSALLVSCLEAVPLKEETFSSSAASAAPAACSSAVCKETAKFFLSSMNATANPCDDFYEFACGAWRTKPIPEDKVQNWVLTEMDDHLNEQIRELLAKYNVEVDGKKNARAVTLAASAYQRCMQLKDNNTEGVQYIKELVDEVLGAWTIGRKVELHKSWQQILVEAMARGNGFPVFSIGLYPDAQNTSKNDLWFSPVALGLGDIQLKNLSANVPLITAYKEYIRSSAKLFSGANCANLEADIDAIVHLESELAQGKLSLDVSRDPANMERKMTLKEFSAQTKMNWLGEIIVPLFKALNVSGWEQITDAQEVIINDIGYLTRVVSVLSKTSPVTVANLVGWRIVTTNGPQSSEVFRQNMLAFERVNLGLKKLPPRSTACYYQVNGHLGYPQMNMAVSRLWIDHHFPPSEKIESEHLVESIQRTFGHMLLDNGWMADEKTRFAALKKLASITRKVGYAEDLLKNEYLDSLYFINGSSSARFDELLKEKNYLKSLRKIGVYGLQSALSQLHGLTMLGDNLWLISPATINAVYFYKDNSITIPAGFLKMPNFDASRPHSLNYGAIGAIVGHEISHGFDDTGRNYDEAGNLRNWWSNATLKEYKSRASCIEKQYSSLVEPMTGMHVNGKSGLGENIGDNGGVHTALEAFKARQLVSPSARLADLPQYSPEQLFFLSWGNAWCGTINLEMNLDDLLQQLLKGALHVLLGLGVCLNGERVVHPGPDHALLATHLAALFVDLIAHQYLRSLIHRWLIGFQNECWAALRR